MEVTFRNSNALSRAHYSLVQRVENAGTSQAVNDIIVQEVTVIQNLLSHSARSSSLRAECLIMLMFCQTVLSINIPELFGFAFPHAVQLAESGRSLRDRRIAYQYCIQCIPPNHEINLMLVNTVRKDLESHNDSRISLALDYLIQSPTNDVIPAISASLESLISSKSSSIKRQALLGIRSLLKFDIGLTAHLVPRLLKRAKDSELGTAVIALDLLLDSRQSSITMDDITQVLLQRMLTITTQSQPVIKALELLEKILINNTNIPQGDLAIDMLLRLLSVTGSRTPMEYGISLGTCRCFSYLPPPKVVKQLGLRPGTIAISPLNHLRPLLSSDDPNAAYTFLSCLSVLDPSLWTGSGMELEHSEHTTLKEQEVKKIMMFLDSNDTTLRQKAYTVIKAADISLLQAHYARVMNVVSILPPDDLSGGGQPAMRALEVLDALRPSSKAYVDGVKSILNKIEQPYSTSASGKDSSTTGSTTRNVRHSLPVMETLVEKVLSHLAQASMHDCKTFIEDLMVAGIGYFLGSPHTSHSRDSPSCPYGATGYTLLAAVAAEYGHLSPVPPASMLQVLSRPLKLASPAVQEGLLLSILKILALCDQRPSWLFETLTAIKAQAGRHIAFRCQQVLDFSEKLEDLKGIAASSVSASLPDFLFALERGPLPSMRSKVVSSPSSKSTKLRYTSYEPPPAILRGRRRRTSSSHSTSISSTSHSRRSYQEVADIDDPRSRTISAGELALKGESGWFQQPPRQGSPHEGEKGLDLITDRIDLISLNTPFRTETQIGGTTPELIPISSLPPSSALEFDLIWGRSNDPSTSARGWSSSSPYTLKNRLDTSSSLSASVVQKEPHDPFIPETTEILILVQSFHNDLKTAVKLKLEDGESCLWQIRGYDQAVLSELKHLFNEED